MGTRQIGLRLPEDLLERVERLRAHYAPEVEAAGGEVTVASLLRRFIEEGVERREAAVAGEAGPAKGGRKRAR